MRFAVLAPITFAVLLLGCESAFNPYDNASPKAEASAEPGADATFLESSGDSGDSDQPGDNPSASPSPVVPTDTARLMALGQEIELKLPSAATSDDPATQLGCWKVASGSGAEKLAVRFARATNQGQENSVLALEVENFGSATAYEIHSEAATSAGGWLELILPHDVRYATARGTYGFPSSKCSVKIEAHLDRILGKFDCTALYTDSGGTGVNPVAASGDFECQLRE